MDLTQDDVIQILKLIDEAPVGRVSLQFGELKLEVVKGEGLRSSAGQEAMGSRAVSSSVSAAAAIQVQPAAAQLAASEKPAPNDPSALAADQGLLTVTAPVLGIFYRRSQPGVPPYVEEGSIIEQDTTVALIELMKLFNPVKAGVSGRIRKICAENGQLVEYGQALFLVEPE